jgi:FkbM family methyltransferase
MSLKFRLKKWYKKLLFNLSASENPVYLSYYKYLYKPKPGSVAEFLDDYSRKNKPVTFLQIGANDGYINDPLHKFIKRDNWKGILLEPQPDVFNRFLIKLHRKRPEIQTINAALDEKDGTRPLFKLSISTERWATGLSSFNREVLVKKLKDGFIMKHIRRQGIVLPENEEEIIVADEVVTISPETLLRKFEKEGFRFLAIDTEGFDFEIMKMLDLGRISPEVILYEEVNFDEKTAQDCQAYLEKHGYSTRNIGRDVLALKNSAG